MAEIAGPSYIPRGTKCKCTMGATEQRLNLLVDHGIIATASREPLMNANDHVPMVNIMPFGFCKKGMPCMPVTPLAWVDVNKKHIIEGAPALTEDSKLACFHGGVITIVPLDAGSAEEGDRNENAEDSVEEIKAEALDFAGDLIAGAAGLLAGRFVGKSGGNAAKNLVKKEIKRSGLKSGGNNGFRSQELLDSHFKKHAGEFGNITKEQYLKGAQDLVNSAPGGDILVKTRPNGDILVYNKAKNEFASKTKDGIIRTYFKPKDGLDYFNRQ